MKVGTNGQTLLSGVRCRTNWDEHATRRLRRLGEGIQVLHGCNCRPGWKKMNVVFLHSVDVLSEQP